MSEMKTLKFPGDTKPREIVDAKARDDISKLSEDIAASGSTVRYDITQTLDNTEKAQARANIGAGTSNFDGRYASLTGKPAIPTKTSDLTNDSGFGTYSKPVGGIPKADLAEEVQTSLGKVAALQSKSIVDTGGYFTTDTVEGALQEIGAELAGINTLLGSGIQISFTIDDATCTANAGQTFSEWVGSGYKTIENGMILSVHPYSDEGIIFLDEAGVYALSLDGNTPVHGGDRIISGATYVAMNWGG